MLLVLDSVLLVTTLARFPTEVADVTFPAVEVTNTTALEPAGSTPSNAFATKPPPIVQLPPGDGVVQDGPLAKPGTLSETTTSCAGAPPLFTTVIT